MRFVLSIPLLFLISFSGISVKFATHYCGGRVAATKISLSGELTTCGMESQEHNNSYQDAFNNHCCEDVTSSYTLSSNYLPSYFNIEESVQKDISLFSVPEKFLSIQYNIFINSTRNIKPPGIIYHNNPDRPVLCIFLI